MSRLLPCVLVLACAARAAAVVAAAPTDDAPRQQPPDGSLGDRHEPHSARLGIDLQSAGRDEYDQFHASGVVAFSEIFHQRWDVGFAFRGHYTWSNRDGDLPTGSLDYLLVPKLRFRGDGDFSPYVGVQLGAQTTWFSRQTGVVGGTSTPTYDRAIATTFAGGGVAGVDVFLDRSVSFFGEASSLYTYVDHDALRSFDLSVGLCYWF
jgi:hypothetical protein